MRRLVSYVTAVFLLVTVSQAANETASKVFRVRAPQRLNGVLQDRQGARIAKLGLQLVRGDTLIKEVTTSDVGEYDFGLIEAGEYRLRLTMADGPWCAPVVKCRRGSCAVRPRVDVCRTPNYKNCKGVCL